MTVLVTGANGFVGAPLCARLAAQGLRVRAAVRSTSNAPAGAEVVQSGDLEAGTDWSAALKDVSEVVHLAARVHVMNEASADPLGAFRRVNVDGTASLARQAARAGVRRFVYMSSIKVHGEHTSPGQAFRAGDLPAPRDSYGVSKMEAEQALRQIASETGMELVIVRPPLVYGPGVRANFAFLMRWLVRGVPLPLASITTNRRSLVALENLIDLVSTCLSHPLAAGETFLISDGEDLSTAELLIRLGRALGHPARLFPVPSGVLKLGATVLGRPGVHQRLCGSLQVDIGHTRECLGWTPPVSVDAALIQTARGCLP